MAYVVMAYAAMAYIVMAYAVMAYRRPGLRLCAAFDQNNTNSWPHGIAQLDCPDAADLGASNRWDYTVMAYMVLAFLLLAFLVMAYTLMAYIVLGASNRRRCCLLKRYRRTIQLWPV